MVVKVELWLARESLARDLGPWDLCFTGKIELVSQHSGHVMVISRRRVFSSRKYLSNHVVQSFKSDLYR